MPIKGIVLVRAAPEQGSQPGGVDPLWQTSTFKNVYMMIDNSSEITVMN